MTLCYYFIVFYVVQLLILTLDIIYLFF